MSHSRLSPSSAHRWVHCPGSVIMSEQFPDPSGAAADEGTACHWVGSEVLEGRGGDSFLGRTAPNGVVITEEMIDAAKVYVGAVRAKASNGQRLLVEQPVTLTQIHPECHGTPDCVWHDGAELHVWDLKYGFGIVDPWDNYQLICYAAGYIQPGTHFVNLTIVQPRPFHADGPVRTWRVGVNILTEYIQRLTRSAHLALQPSPETTSGPHCKYCSARHACPAAQRVAMFAIDYTCGSRPELLTPAALAIELRTLYRATESLQYRITGLEGQAKGLITTGTPVPGFEMQGGAGRQQWRIPVAEVLAVGDVMGIPLRKSPDSLTPAQAKKAGLPDDLLAAFTERLPGEVKLTAVNTNKYAGIFSANKE